MSREADLLAIIRQLEIDKKYYQVLLAAANIKEDEVLKKRLLTSLAPPELTAPDKIQTVTSL